LAMGTVALSQWNFVIIVAGQRYKKRVWRKRKLYIKPESNRPQYRTFLCVVKYFEKMLSRRLLQNVVHSNHGFNLRCISSNIKDTKIGMIGMGGVGDCLFNNLGRNGFKVATVTDIDLGKCDKYKSDGCSVVGSAKEVAEASDVIISGLPSPPSVKTMFDDLLRGLSKDKIWIDHSTTDYGQNFEFEKEVKAKGAEMLEAPISGGLDALMYGEKLTGNKRQL
jgi:hypothetical protein